VRWASLPAPDGMLSFPIGTRERTSTSRARSNDEPLAPLLRARTRRAAYAPGPNLKEFFGYSEPLRRFIQREGFEPQANESANIMPSWLPSDDYMTNFKVGDPYVRIDDGYARLPGAGYEALHPELKGVDPEEYPDIHKLRILADVAPYSREYNTRSFRPAATQKPRAHALRRPAVPHAYAAFSEALCSTQEGHTPLCRASLWLRSLRLSSPLPCPVTGWLPAVAESRFWPLLGVRVKVSRLGGEYEIPT
jgi:hypothetical protein